MFLCIFLILAHLPLLPFPFLLSLYFVIASQFSLFFFFNLPRVFWSLLSSFLLPFSSFPSPPHFHSHHLSSFLTPFSPQLLFTSSYFPFLLLFLSLLPCITPAHSFFFLFVTFQFLCSLSKAKKQKGITVFVLVYACLWCLQNSEPVNRF